MIASLLHTGSSAAEMANVAHRLNGVADYLDQHALGLPYQGPPGCVHGGISALLLDHALGVANHWGPGPSGMTGTLTLRYHRTTPLFEELVVTARQASTDGRKIYTSGSISADGRVCVSADAVFIAKFVDRPR